MQPVRRPTSVTFVSWLFIVAGFLNGIGAPLSYITFNNEAVRAEVEKQGRDDPNVARGLQELSKITIVDVGVSVGLSMLYIVGGVFMIQGANWARWLTLGLVVMAAAGVVMSTADIRALFFAVIAGLLVFMLMRKPADEFFKSAAEDR